MVNYFHSIVKSTSLDELQILGLLNDQDATETFKAISKREVMELLNFKRTKAQTLFSILESKNFITVVRDANMHKLIINEFGQVALEESIKGVDM